MHDKKTHVSLVLATSLLLCLPIAGTAQGGPPGGGPGGGAPQTVITKAVPDLTGAPVIFIEGAEFGATPVVLLGEDMGTLSELVVAGSTDTSITAELPVGLEPAIYLLVVESGAARIRSFWCEFPRNPIHPPLALLALPL